MEDTNFTITNKTRAKIPSLPYLNIKNTILGKKYNLSLVFVDEKKSRELNRSYRNIDNQTNILSFPLDKNIGEIFITPNLTKKEASLFGKKPGDFIGLLFIHGLLHLKGMEHGSKMELLEARFQKKFGI